MSVAAAAKMALAFAELTGGVKFDGRSITPRCRVSA